jgi:serine phosphatase RsbU (regulator of sigma subunit)
MYGWKRSSDPLQPSDEQRSKTMGAAVARVELRGHEWAQRLGRLAVDARPASQPGAAQQPRSLRRQVARAALIQRSLLPDIDVPVGGFRLAGLYWPCEALGGDFFDLARRHDSGVLMVADVMGHGVEAALITMLVKAAFQEAVAGASDPGQLLVGMRARLRRMVPPDRTFVATMIVRLDLQGSSLEIANAGMPHPFVLRGAARGLDEVVLDGVPLGLLDDLGHDGYPASPLTLAPGDVLLITSDGLGSVEGPAGDYFEDHRLRQELATLTGRGGREVINHLAADAKRFSHGRRLPDDVNLIAVWRTGPGPATTGPCAGRASDPPVN